MFERLGLYQGALVGLMLGLGVWGLDAAALGAANVRLAYAGPLFGCAALGLIGAGAGWLSARLDKAALSALIWLAASGLMTWIIGRWPYEGRSLTLWLADLRFSGLPIYPFDAVGQLRLLMAGFFIVVLLTVMGLVQAYRLEGVQSGLGAGGRLSGRGWLLMALPAPLVFGVGLIADNIVNQPWREAPEIVAEAIRTGRTYEGDLFALGRERGVAYAAIAGVRQQMSADFVLEVGEFDSLGPTILVLAHFDNGAWVVCRVLADHLSHCFDANPPYLRGFPAVLTGQPLADCPACRINVSDDLLAWLQARAARLGERPIIARLAQQGSYALMRAESRSGDYALECWLRGLSPVRLERCVEASSTPPFLPTSAPTTAPSLLTPTAPTPAASPTTTSTARFTNHPQEMDAFEPTWSPDGGRMAYIAWADGNWEIYLAWLEGGPPLRLTHNQADDMEPAWSPDGRRLAFSSFRDGNWELYVMDADCAATLAPGGGCGANVIRLTDHPADDFEPEWSPD